ncbi:MAG: hypothetical protein J2P13_12570, partial [Acidobacteria bacterium]|nr:hypothetical protein [Acidobacteriota bacterium]
RHRPSHPLTSFATSYDKNLVVLYLMHRSPPRISNGGAATFSPRPILRSWQIYRVPGGQSRS